MYVDKKRVRRPYCRLRLDRYEAHLIDAVIARTGEERAVVVREMVLRQAHAMLGFSSQHEAASRALYPVGAPK